MHGMEKRNENGMLRQLALLFDLRSILYEKISSFIYEQIKLYENNIKINILCHKERDCKRR